VLEKYYGHRWTDWIEHERLGWPVSSIGEIVRLGWPVSSIGEIVASTDDWRILASTLSLTNRELFL
jgi:hypothetical protein